MRSALPAILIAGLASTLLQATDVDDMTRDATAWLAAQQRDRGYWQAAKEGPHEVGVTGLALLALHADGSNVASGPHREAVRAGLEYLIHVQDADTGCFGAVNGHLAFIYDHTVSTTAMLVAYRHSRWPRLREPIERALQFIERARNPYKAWRYSFPPDGNNDMSVTGWAVTALAEARRQGFEVSDAAIAGARMFCDEMTDPRTWRTGYLQRGGYSARNPGANERWPENSTEAMTAVAVCCRFDWGEHPDSSEALAGGIRRVIERRLPTADDAGAIDFCYWYHGSRAMALAGGEPLNVWRDRLVAALTALRVSSGEDRGSWPSEADAWGATGGQAYATAMNVLALREVVGPRSGTSGDAVLAELEVRPLIDAIAPGEAMRFAARIPGASGSLERLSVRLRRDDKVVLAAGVDVATLPGVLVDVPLWITVHADGFALSPTAELPVGHRPVFRVTSDSPVDLDRAGEWQLALAGALRTEEGASAFAGTAALHRHVDLAVASPDALRTAARSVVALKSDVEVPARSPVFAITGSLDERVVTLRVEGDEPREFRVHLDLTGLPRKVVEMSVEDDWQRLFAGMESKSE